ncbi:MAG: nucleoside hydrolase [Clostridia bacterium]|nr:nucleoside hydrolase [Clostridia bacterium]
MTKEPVKIILDCDPGHDDALAILLAAASPAVDLLAITTVGGNQTLEKVTLNARRVCTVAGIRDVPIAAGCPGPLARPLETAPDIHGDTGLDGHAFPEPDVPLASVHAVDLILDILRREPAGTVTLVPTGPLTNLAVALCKDPHAFRRAREIVWMGGALGLGNVTPAAEFNAYVDPEAARAVFESGVPVVMHGLHLTHQVRVTDAVRERIAAMDTPVARMVSDLMAFYADRYRRRFEMGDPPLHDPCAVAFVIDRSMFRTQRMRVDVETRGKWTAGMTVCDVHGVTGRPANAEVAMEIDVVRFWDMMLGALASLPVQSR